LHHDNFVSDTCEVFVFLADRAQHIAEIVVPAINEGKVVLCDRHTDSHMAYQGYGRGGDLKQLKYLNDIAVNGTYPDLTFVFNVDIETASKRVGDKKDRLEALGTEFHKKVQNGYLEIAKAEPNRVKVIDANKDIDGVFAQVKEHLDNLI
jgi:dTMP kinase